MSIGDELGEASGVSLVLLPFRNHGGMLVEYVDRIDWGLPTSGTLADMQCV
jgi:hypothetical protein